MQAAVVRRKLPHLPGWTADRQAVAKRYAEGLGDLPELSLPVPLPGGTHVYHLYTMRARRRDELVAHLKSRQIGCGVYYPVPLHRQPCFAKYHPAACPVSERLSTEVVSLPCFPGLRPDEQDVVVAAVRSFYGR